jgi:hypothetical protein
VIAASAASEVELPRTVTCWTDTEHGPEEVEFPTDQLRKTVFYRLADNAATRQSRRQTA